MLGYRDILFNVTSQEYWCIQPVHCHCSEWWLCCIIYCDHLSGNIWYRPQYIAPLSPTIKLNIYWATFDWLLLYWVYQVFCVIWIKLWNSYTKYWQLAELSVFPSVWWLVWWDAIWDKYPMFTYCGPSKVWISITNCSIKNNFISHDWKAW